MEKLLLLIVVFFQKPEVNVTSKEGSKETGMSILITTTQSINNTVELENLEKGNKVNKVVQKFGSLTCDETLWGDAEKVDVTREVENPIPLAMMQKT